MKKQKTVRERVDAICKAETLRRRKQGNDDPLLMNRLSQLLRVHRGTLQQEAPATSLLDWALRRCEEEGISYYENMEEKLGIFGKEK